MSDAYILVKNSLKNGPVVKWTYFKMKITYASIKCDFRKLRFNKRNLRIISIFQNHKFIQVII